MTFPLFFFCLIGTETPMSPFYNWACGIDIKMEEHTQLVQESISQNSNITQGIKLIKIWLAQRKLDTVSSMAVIFFLIFLFCFLIKILINIFVSIILWYGYYSHEE